MTVPRESAKGESAFSLGMARKSARVVLSWVLQDEQNFPRWRRLWVHWPFAFKAQSVSYPKEKLTYHTGFLITTKLQAEPITFSYHLTLPGERPRVRGKKDQKQLDRSLYWANLPHPCVLRPRPLLKKPSVWWEVLAEGWWWDTECSEPHMGLCWKGGIPRRGKLMGEYKIQKEHMLRLFHFTNILRTFQNAV